MGGWMGECVRACLRACILACICCAGLSGVRLEVSANKESASIFSRKKICNLLFMLVWQKIAN